MKILLILLFCLIAQNTWGDDSLVAHWQLDEGANFVAQDSSSSGSSDGQLINGPSWVNGKLGGGLRFDGINDYIDVGDPPILRLTSSMTLALWVYLEQTRESHTLISRNGGFGDVGWGFYIEDGYPTLKIGQPGEKSKTSTRPSSVRVSPGQWYHLVSVYDAGAKTLDIYVDGVLRNGVLNGLTPGSQRNSGQHINIGRRVRNPEGTTRRHLKGVLDDIRIYNRALSAQEITALAQGGESEPSEFFSQVYEAEDSTLFSPFTVASDSAASEGFYIAATSLKSTNNPKREATLAFTVPSEGIYYLWARLKALSGQSDAIFVGIDQSWDRVYPKVKNIYQWVPVNEFSLAEGEHVFQIGHAEIGSRLDALFLTNDSSEVPN